MAKKRRKLLALLLALTLIVGQLAVPAMATEGANSASNGNPQPPAPENVQITETPVDHGTSTTVTYTDPSTGAAVTSTQTITTDPVSGGTTVENTQTATSTETTTTSIPNYYYKMENVKDSDAYDESERRHIQAIAKYGYWGNSDPADEEEAKTGSLAAISCGR